MMIKAVAYIFAGLLAPGVALAQPADKQRIGAFLIDRIEVSIAQFRRHAEAARMVTAAEREGGGYEYAAGWVRRAGWTVYWPFGEAPDTEAHPAVHVTWAEAQAYCRAHGGRLPTVQEWLQAAYVETRRDPPTPFVTGQRYTFPTGDSPDGANMSTPDRWPRSAPVGQTAPGVNGLYDMGGNVWEWVADHPNDTGGGEKRTMGGSWWYGPEQMKAEANYSKPAAFYAVYVGFRCAYDAPA
ncbi:formylglycine-generating enzyme family protein [Ferrovibrio terrae]|uniref:formylglycine-generating enzyme family protein n=1 Tax=Ferrovibrio terrae TaxID=2594003 RepID=UPI0031379B9F